MKRIVLLLCMAASVAANAQTANTAATVETKEGFLIFVMSQPQKPYDVIDSLDESFGGKFITNLTSMHNKTDLQYNIDILIKKVYKKADKADLKKIDALIIADDGHSCKMIHFK